MADDLDETIEETFPASDAPSNTPETGIRIDPAPETPPEPPKEEETPSTPVARPFQGREESDPPLPAAV